MWLNRMHLWLADRRCYQCACTVCVIRWLQITREPGPVKGGETVIAFAEDPTGYKWELIQRPQTPEPLCQVSSTTQAGRCVWCGCSCVWCSCSCAWCGWTLCVVWMQLCMVWLDAVCGVAAAALLAEQGVLSAVQLEDKS